MKYEWIIDVLTDLKAFAQLNGLSVLAEQLDDTKLVAACELAKITREESFGAHTHAATAGGIYRAGAESENA